jgi:uncharacterized protein
LLIQRRGRTKFIEGKIGSPSIGDILCLNLLRHGNKALTKKVDMKAKRSFTLTALVVGLIFPALVAADTIYLKRGEKVTGQIVGETSYSIQVRVNGLPVRYFLTEIDKIEREDGTTINLSGVKSMVVPTVTPGPPAPVSEAKKQLILRLLEANGARENMNKIFAMIIAKAPAESREELKGVLKSDEIIERLVPIYAQYYSDDDLKELINFYKSPVGSKHLQLTPKILEESLNAAVVYFQEKVGDKMK